MRHRPFRPYSLFASEITAKHARGLQPAGASGDRQHPTEAGILGRHLPAALSSPYDRAAGARGAVLRHGRSAATSAVHEWSVSHTFAR